MVGVDEQRNNVIRSTCAYTQSFCLFLEYIGSRKKYTDEPTLM